MKLKDKRVGEIWKWLHTPDFIELPMHREGRDLIVTLVEERTELRKQLMGKKPPGNWTFRELACRDFGIPQEEFKKFKDA